MTINKEMFSLAGKKAWVTGGSRGIGKTLALTLAAFGADVAVVDILREEAETAAAEIRACGVDSFAVTADVTVEADVDAMAEAIRSRWGRVDIALNNAGVVCQVPAVDMSYADWKRVVDINLNGVFLTARAAGRMMISGGGGSIVNTASMSAWVVNHPQPQCSYNASKAGVVQLTKSLAVEWAPHNIRVNCISPGYIRTELTAQVRQDWQDDWIRQSVMKRLGVPEDLAGIVVYLASDASPFTTGSDFIVDGGFTCV
ncbi:MAG: SDR family oxidoreductase [Planctomycetes bacterium]|nr:SDR family oxidoreductase [Planctomycetota bacterium]